MTLEGYWPLHDGSAQDYSGNGNHGTLNGGPKTGIAGKAGLQATSLDGTDDYIDVSYNSSNTTVERTLSMWVRKKSTTSAKEIFSYSNTLKLSYEVNGSNGYEANLYDGSAWNTVESGITTSGEWLHLVYVYDGSNLKLYINGVKEGSSSVPSPRDVNYSEWIGANGNGRYFDGAVCDVRNYKRALSGAEIQALYQMGSQETANPPTDGVARYALDGDATDSWNNNDGTTSGSLSYSSDAIRGQSGDFDGSDDLVDIPNVPQLSAYTISGWVKPDAPNNGSKQIIMILIENNSVQVRTNGTGTLQIYHSDGSWAEVLNHPIEDEWYFFTVTWDGSTVNAYINGVLINQISASSITGKGNGDSIGANTGYGNNFDGHIDDIRIYDYALTPSEVFELYQWGTRGKDLRKHLINRRQK